MINFSKGNLDYENLKLKLINFGADKRHNEHVEKEKALFNKPTVQCFKCGNKGHKANQCRTDTTVTCPFCNKKGHTEEQCRAKKNSSNNPTYKKQLQCTNCKRSGHTVNRCFKLKNANRSAQMVTSNVVGTIGTSFSFISGSFQSSNFSFILDSGCTSHMIKDRELFETFSNSVTDVKVATADATENIIEGTGDVYIIVGTNKTFERKSP